MSLGIKKSRGLVATVAIISTEFLVRPAIIFSHSIWILATPVLSLLAAPLRVFSRPIVAALGALDPVSWIARLSLGFSRRSVNGVAFDTSASFGEPVCNMAMLAGFSRKITRVSTKNRLLTGSHFGFPKLFHVGA
jgi:hypothetical protein